MDDGGRARWGVAAVAEEPAVEPADASLTGATVVAFTLGLAGTTAAWAGIAEVETAAVGFLALVTGVVLAVPTVATGFLCYLNVPRGSALLRTATARWAAMTAAVALFLVAAAILDDGYRSGDVPAAGAGVAAGAELVLIAGAMLGGSLPRPRPRRPGR